MPFERLVEELAPSRSLARHPLVQTVLTMQNAGRAKLDMPGVRAGGASSAVAKSASAQAKFDLYFPIEETFDAQGRPAGIRGGVTAAADLFDVATAARIGEWFARVLETVSGAPDVRLHEVQVLAAEEIELLAGWNDTAAPVGAGCWSPSNGRWRRRRLRSRWSPTVPRRPSRTLTRGPMRWRSTCAMQVWVPSRWWVCVCPGVRR